MTSSFLTRLYVSLGVTVSNGLSGFIWPSSSSSASSEESSITLSSSPSSRIASEIGAETELIVPMLSNDRDTENLEKQHDLQYTPEAEKDRITFLPGYDDDNEDEIPFAQFSGYLRVAPTRHVHYWYVESQNDPSTDPVVFWTNGGPGCSGLLGLGTEHGPFFFLSTTDDESSDSEVKLTLNPYSWNKVANMLYVEQPAGVGFSYVDTHQDLVTGDHQAARDNVQLLKEFFRRFPERQDNPFYISSESYGGHYMPQLTWELLRCINGNNNNNNNGDDDECDEPHLLPTSFTGMMVGNPFVDPFTNMITMFQSYYAHGLVSKLHWSPVVENGCLSEDTFDPSVCENLLRRIFNNVGNGINPYALDFPVCTRKPIQYDLLDDSSLLTMTRLEDPYHDRMHSGSSQSLALLHQHARLLGKSASHDKPPFLPRQDDYKPCEENYFDAWLNRQDVQQALHIEASGSGEGGQQQWSACSRELQYSEVDANTPQITLYRQLVQEGVKGNHDLKLLVFSGDDDSICSLGGTQEWIYDLGVHPLDDASTWKPWTCQATNQTAGFLTHFDLGNATNATFSLATVHGAGHEVPAYRPIEALELFQRYLSGTL